jgi:hypothetical protein
MEDYNILIQLTKEKFQALDKKGQPYCFSIIAEYDDPAKEPFKVAKALTGIPEFTRKINVAISQLKANRVKVTIYKSVKENAGHIEDEFYLSLPDAGSETTRRNENDVLTQISDMLNRQTTLAGVVEEKTTQLAEMQNKYERDLVGISHKIELDRRDEQIAKYKIEIEELRAENKDVTESLSKFQKIYDDEQEMQSWGKKIGGVLKGVVAVVPGVVKWAESKPMLAGLPQAIMSGGGEMLTDQSGQGDAQPVDYNSPQFQKMQRVLQFVQGLTEDETNLFVEIVEKIESDKSNLLTVLQLLR